MASVQLETAPYAPPANVIEVIRHARKRGLPDTITPRVLTSIGIPDGNVSRTLAALRFLRLIEEEDDHKSDAFEQLARVTDDEYPDLLAQVIRKAYATVFTYVDPADDDAVKLNNVFRQHYNPQAQRSRMVTLFLALCREAGIVQDGAPEPRTRTRRVTLSKDQSAKPARSVRGTAASPELEQPPLMQTGGSHTASLSLARDTNSDYALCLETLRRLPPDHRWTAKQRKRWLAAIEANVDLLVEVIEESEEQTRALTLFETDSRSQ